LLLPHHIYPMRQNITVTLETRNNLLRLRWNDGKRRSLSLGITDSIPNRSIAKKKKELLEQDIANDCFDGTRGKYKLLTIGNSCANITAPRLIKQFKKHKLAIGEISELTARIRYRNTESALRANLDIDISAIGRKDAETLARHFSRTVSPEVAKSQLQLLKAAWDWARDSHQLLVNPWEGLAARCRSIDRKEPEPFTSEEVRAIIDGFRSSPKYSHYTDFVIFLFHTGCRFGEAVAVKWKAVKSNYSWVWIGESITEGHHNPTTKTGKARNVLLSPSLVKMLKARQSKTSPEQNSLIFPEIGGKSIDCGKFRYYWKKILKAAGVPYRTPYNTRHTAISHALENGANPVDVAAQTGHSLKTLYERYAAVIAPKQVFAEF
jgi:integrase